MFGMVGVSQAAPVEWGRIPGTEYLIPPNALHSTALTLGGLTVALYIVKHYFSV